MKSFPRSTEPSFTTSFSELLSGPHTLQEHKLINITQARDRQVANDTGKQTVGESLTLPALCDLGETPGQNACDVRKWVGGTG